MKTSRRHVLVGSASLAALTAAGCKGTQTDSSSTVDSLPGIDTGPLPDVGDPEISSQLWQTMAAYVRVSADGSLGTRVSLFNPAPVPQRVVLQLFTLYGQLVLREEVDSLAAEHSDHIELQELLNRNDVPLPFEGHLWVGTTPESGNSFMGLQGIIFDWYGPAHVASVHGMRDFGNSNLDSTWSDLILPKVVSTERYVTRVAVVNATADGVAEALYANPEVIIRNDDGDELVRTVLEEIAPYCATVFDVDKLPGGEALSIGSIQIKEAEAGLVAMAFLVDRDNDGFVSADHFFDRHFVTHLAGFVG